MAWQNRNNGLDTLSVEELRRYTDRWTGELSAVDTLSYDNIASDELVDAMIQQWHQERLDKRNISAEELFGQQSELLPQEAEAQVVEQGAELGDVANVEQVAQMGDALPMAADSVDVTATAAEPSAMISLLPEWSVWAYNALVLIAMGVYVYSIYLYYEDVIAMFSSVFRSKVLSSHGVRERRQSIIFYGFLGKLLLLGVLFVGVLSLGVVVRGGTENWLGSMQEALWMPVVVIVALAALMLVQHTILYTIGWVTRSQAVVKSMLQMRTVYFVFITIVVAPILILAQMGWMGVYEGWLYVGCALAAISVLLYLKESLSLFISKKVSILHWILYLCTVEVLPLSFLWQLIQSKLGS